MSLSYKYMKSIQTKEDLDATLQILPKKSPYNIVFNNVVSKLRVGGREISTYYPTIFCAENVTLLLPESSEITSEEFEDEFALNRKAGTVTLLKPQSEREEKTEKEVQFVNTTLELIKQIEERKEWNDDLCVYYPKMKGKITISQELEDGERVEMDETQFKGVIDFQDKTLLIPLASPLSHRNVLALLWDNEAYAELNFDTEFPEYEKTGNSFGESALKK